MSQVVHAVEYVFRLYTNQCVSMGITRHDTEMHDNNRLVEEPALEAQGSFLSGYFPLEFPSTRQPQCSGTIYP